MISFAALPALAYKALKRFAASAGRAANSLQIIELKRFFTLRNAFLIFILLLLHYFLSDGTVIDFIKQLLGWIIVPFLSSLLKAKR